MKQMANTILPGRKCGLLYKRVLDVVIAAYIKN